MTRLIEQASVLDRLLAAVAAVPAGVKISIPQLRDHLVSQADVLAGLQRLVESGALDRETLRPPAAAAAHSMVSAVTQDGRPCRRTSPPRAVRNPVSHEGAKARSGTKEIEPPPITPSAGAALAAELDVLIARLGLSKSQVGTHLFSNTNGVEMLRRSNPRRKTVDKVKAFLANPPSGLLRRMRAPAGDRRYVANKRDTVRSPLPVHDPTQPPIDPALEHAERLRVAQARQIAASRRESEQRAAALLDRGVDPKSQNSMTQAQMRAIAERREAAAREVNPVEQAKLALQRRGRVVYSASVSGGRKDRFIVSGQSRELTPAELIDLAEKVTGKSFRRAAADAAVLERGAAPAARKGACA